MAHLSAEESFMRSWPTFIPLAGVALLVACEATVPPTVRFWRPISEPNLLMASEAVQEKLEFDLSQCHCGIFPANTTRDATMKYQKDKQRLAQTGVTITPDEEGQCAQKPSLVVSECMRQRGWEPTNCSGRVPVPGGGSLCGSYVKPE
jgi:hypothetical protein